MSLNNQKEFKAIFFKLYSPLCNFVSNYLDDDIYAEDVVQDIFLKVWENKTLRKEHKNIEAYLFEACKNRAFELIRKQKNESKYKEKIEWLDRVDGSIIEKEKQKYLRLEQLNKLIRQLPPKCQQVFILHKQNGLTYNEIAGHLGISAKTVENQMIRALKILRNAISK